MSIIHHTYHILRNFPRVLWLLTGATFLNQMGNMAMVFLIIYLTQHNGFTLSQASFAYATAAFTLMLTGLISGPVIDKLGAARIMIIFLFLNGLILLIFPWMHTPFFIFVTCFFWGFTFGFYRAASQTFVSLLATPGTQKIAFSVYRLAINLGMSIGPAIGGYLATHSFVMVFYLNAATNILAGTLLFYGLYRSIWFRMQPIKAFTLPSLKFFWFMQDKSLRLFLFAIVPISMVFFQHATTLSVFLYQNLHLPLSFYGLLFTMNTLIIVFCELPLNVATLSWSPRISLMLGSFLIALGFSGYFFATNQFHIIVLTIIWTIGEMILYPAATTFIAELSVAEHRGSYMSIYNTFSNIGIFLGPWLGALVMQRYHAHGLWVACAFCGLISIYLFSHLRISK